MKRWVVTFIMLSLVLLLSGCASESTSSQWSKALDTHVKQVTSLSAEPQKEDEAVSTSVSLNDQNVQWAFTQADEHPEKLLVEVIDGSTGQLDIAIYSLTHPDIVKAILDAEKRGVSVRVITDEQQAGGQTQKQALKMIYNAGVAIKIDNHSGLMHLKMTIADKQVATIGSYNYSKAASTTNDEVIMVLRDKTLATSFEHEFESMWTDTVKFQDYFLSE